jgi:hypothetical protein
LRNGTIAEVYNNTTDIGIAVTGVPVSRAEVNRMMIRYQEGMSIPKEYALTWYFYFADHSFRIVRENVCAKGLTPYLKPLLHFLLYLVCYIL